MTVTLSMFIIHLVSLACYSGFRRKARVLKCKRFGRQKGVMVPGVPCVDHGNWGRETRHLLALRDRMRCFGNNRALFIHLTYKDVDRFQKRSVHKLYCLKASQVSKVHARNVLVR